MEKIVNVLDKKGQAQEAFLVSLLQLFRVSRAFVLDAISHPPSTSQKIGWISIVMWPPRFHAGIR
jgi:hypothetical protein